MICCQSKLINGKEGIDTLMLMSQELVESYRVAQMEALFQAIRQAEHLQL